MHYDIKGEQICLAKSAAAYNRIHIFEDQSYFSWNLISALHFALLMVNMVLFA